MSAWALCADGCSLHHRPGDADPRHDPAWLARERVRLLGEVARLRGVPEHPVTGAEFLAAAREAIAPRSDEEIRAIIADLGGDPVDEIAAARAARDVPLLTDAANDHGVSVGVQLEPPPPRLTPRPRRR